jgi:hypothetical protein
MGKITVNIDDNLEDRFRRAAAELFGYKQGNFTKALHKAMEDFLLATTNTSSGKNPAASSWREKKGKNPSQ